MAANDISLIEAILGPANQPTLVKFNSPAMVGKGDPNGMLASPDFGKSDRLSNLAACQDSISTRMDPLDILDKISPSREWIVDGDIWRQTVSSTPATRGDVIALEEQLHIRLKRSNAKVAGICGIRHELFAQCFDEIIRQVTINCSERGRLLLRVRDETNTTLNAYRSIYESSAAFIMRKSLCAYSQRSNLEKKLLELHAERETIDITNRELETKYADLVVKFEEQEIADEKRHHEEAEALRQANEQMKILLENSINPATKKPPADPPLKPV